MATSCVPSVGASSTHDWSVEVVDPDALNAYVYGSHLPVLLDDQGNIHLGYSANGTVRHASNAGGSWSTESIGLGSNCDVTMAYDKSGSLHVVSYDFYNSPGAVQDIVYKDGSWRTYTIPLSITRWASTPTVTFDADGNMHLVYIDLYDIFNGSFGYTAGRLKHATEQDGVWSTHTVYASNTTIESLAVLVDSQGKFHCAFTEALTPASGSADQSPRVVYLTDAEGSWKSETVSQTNGSYFSLGYVSLSLDSGDHPVIGFSDWTGSFNLGTRVNETIYVATKESNVWTRSSVIQDFRIQEFAMALDSHDKTHMAIHDKNNDDPLYATNAAGSWVVERIQSVGLTGMSPSILVDSNDHPHIFFLNYTGSYYEPGMRLMHATFTSQASGIAGELSDPLVLAATAVSAVAALVLGMVVSRRMRR